MKLSKPVKVLVLVATLLMPVYMILFMGSMFLDFGDGDSLIFKSFHLFFAIHLGIMLLNFVLIAFYIVYLFKSARVPTEQKALWAIVIFMGGPIAMPVFWYLHIWPEPPG